MKRVLTLALASMAIWMSPSTEAYARMVCTIVADARSGAVLHKEGDCDTPVTPASTFKIPLAVMGYDSGFLTSADAPALPFREGYADWGGEAWKQTATPTRWMKHSIVWYSQQITRDLGEKQLAAYASAFDYGNADVSGDPGRNNALERSWISSSLKISPTEQVGFLRRLITGQLPVSIDATRQSMALVEPASAGDGWAMRGKTGSAFPRNADGSFNRARGWGWFVGWATRGDTALVFARLDQDEQRNSRSGGIRAREALLADWPRVVKASGH